MSDLVHRHQFHGMTYAQVCQLLGPDDGGNCTDFQPMRAGVKVSAAFATPGQAAGLADPRPGPKCGKPLSASGKYGMFGGLAPHFMYTIRESRALGFLDYQTTYLILIFCENGTVDRWLLQVND